MKPVIPLKSRSLLHAPTSFEKEEKFSSSKKTIVWVTGRYFKKLLPEFVFTGSRRQGTEEIHECCFEENTAPFFVPADLIYAIV